MSTPRSSTPRGLAPFAHAVDFVHSLANEPSVGQYYVREHVQKSCRTLCEVETGLRRAANEAHTATLDAKDASHALVTMHDVGEPTMDAMRLALERCAAALRRIPPPSHRHRS